MEVFFPKEKKINLQYFKLLLDGLQISKYFLSFYEKKLLKNIFHKIE